MTTHIIIFGRFRSPVVPVRHYIIIRCNTNQLSREREVAEVLIAWLNRTYRDFPGGGSDRAYWDGESIVHVHPQWAGEDGYIPTRIAPDADGRYAIGSQEWTWIILTGPQ